MSPPGRNSASVSLRSSSTPPAPSGAPRALRGVGISPGWADGTIWCHRPPSLAEISPQSLHASSVEGEQDRFLEALARARREVEDIKRQVAGDVGPAEASIFDGHIALLADPLLRDPVLRAIQRRRVCAATALAGAVERLEGRLAGGRTQRLRKRALDVRDVANRVLRCLCAVEGRQPLAGVPPGTLLVAGELSPSDCVGLDRAHVAGIALEYGGMTSHVAILARSLGIPAVSGLTGLMAAARPGEAALLDGTKGAVVLRPNPAQVRRHAGRQARFDRALVAMRAEEAKACRLRDGTRIRLAANINQAEDLPRIREHHLDGIGLYRTEFMFLSAPVPPTLAQQVRAFSRAAEAVGNRRMILRLFDFSADKRPAYMSRETGPADARGLALALRLPRLLRTQVRAVLRCARSHPRLCLALPMVTDLPLLEEFIAFLRDMEAREGAERPLTLGAMIEHPASIFLLPDIARHVDHLLLGSNDLAMYTLGAHRDGGGGDLRSRCLHGAVLRGIRQVVEGAGQHRCRVSLCGEAASDPLLAAVLVGLGLRELSVTPVRAPEVRFTLRQIRLEEARNAAGLAMHHHPREALEAIRHCLPPDVQRIEA